MIKYRFSASVTVQVKTPFHDEKVFGLRSAGHMMSGDFRIPELRLGPPEGGNHLLVPPSPCQPRRRHSWICSDNSFQYFWGNRKETKISAVQRVQFLPFSKMAVTIAFLQVVITLDFLKDAVMINARRNKMHSEIISK
ncbi:hypothetical protein HHI36_009405 [Cryptolaemus montrouzieri]|uniref:Uncharacterized protein n=1 Tax=Cryptolaemus montrouzieri TaxID=559131 RepID=A0ABD2MW65_9CUCU